MKYEHFDSKFCLISIFGDAELIGITEDTLILGRVIFSSFVADERGSKPDPRLRGIVARTAEIWVARKMVHAPFCAPPQIKVMFCEKKNVVFKYF